MRGNARRQALNLPTDFYWGVKPAIPEIELLSCWRMRLKTWLHPNLQAPYWRLYRNGDNHGIITWRGQTFPLQKGKLYLIAPETPFASELDGECDHLFAHFLARTPFDHCRDHIQTIAENAAMRVAVELITGELNREYQTPLAAMAVFSLIAAALITLPPETLTVPRPDPRLLPVVKMIDAAPEKAYANEMLAGMAGMSVNSFIRRFRTGFGVSPQQFIVEERLRRACFMLQYSGRSIDEIAELTGFCDRFYFTRMFTRYRNISPAEFRKTGPAGLAPYGGRR